MLVGGNCGLNAPCSAQSTTTLMLKTTTITATKPLNTKIKKKKKGTLQGQGKERGQKKKGAILKKSLLSYTCLSKTTYTGNTERRKESHGVYTGLRTFVR